MKTLTFVLLFFCSYAYSQNVRVYTTEEAESLGSIGVVVLPDKEFLRINGVSPGSPAETAGLKKGDLIIQIDDKPLDKVEPEKRIDLVRGKKGTKVTLSIVRAEPKSEFKVIMERVSIHQFLKPKP